MSHEIRRTSGALVLAMTFGLSAYALGAAPDAFSPDERDATSMQRGDAYFHLMKARLAAGRGRPSEVQRELREAIELVPGSADLKAEGANLLAAVGRRDEAEKMARQALEIDRQQPQATRTLADLLAVRALSPTPDTGARAEAIHLYEKLAEAPDSDAQVLQVLTNLKLLDDDLAGAVEVAWKFSARRPGDLGAARLLAHLLLQQGKPEEALRALLAFLSRNPDAVDLVPIAVDLATRTGRWADVEEAGRAIAAARPENTGAQVLWGESLVRLDKSDAAVPVLEKALEGMQDPATWEERGRAVLGEAYLRLGRSPDAVVQLEKALALGQGDSLVRLHLASAYGFVGRLADASALAKGLAGDYPGNPAILVVLGECLSQQGMIDAAVEAFGAAREALDGQDEETVRRRDELRARVAMLYLGRRKYQDAGRALAGLERPDVPAAVKLRARVALSTGRIREARQLARKLKDAEDLGIVALIEGEALLREGHVAKAEAKFGDAISSLGSDSRDRVAVICREAGHPELGEQILRAWVRQEPSKADAQFALGRYLERAGRFADAEGALRETLSLDPRNGEALNYLGYSLADRNERLDEALALIRRALEIEQWNGAFLDSLGWVYFRMGQYDKARDPLEHAAREFPRDPTVLEHLGDLYNKLGDHEGAARTWRRALEAEPEDAEALRSKISGEKDAGAKTGRERTAIDAPPRADRPAVAPDSR